MTVPEGLTARPHGKSITMQRALEFCLHISGAHTSLMQKLDDVLGTLHGLSYSDFMLLHLLSRADAGRLPVADLARPLGLSLSAVTRQLILLEKTGLALREQHPGDGGRRYAAIRSGGRKTLHGAIVTAAALCAEVVNTLPAATLADVQDAMRCIGRSEVLDLT